MRLLKLLTPVSFITTILFLSAIGHAGNMGPMHDFYDGLADILERNANSPDNCIAQAERFIDANAPSLNKAVQRGAQRSRQMSAVEAEMEWERMQRDPSAMSGMQAGMDALNRFMAVFNAFAMKYPDHAEKIDGFMQKFQPESEDY